MVSKARVILTNSNGGGSSAKKLGRRFFAGQQQQQQLQTVHTLLPRPPAPSQIHDQRPSPQSLLHGDAGSHSAYAAAAQSRGKTCDDSLCAQQSAGFWGHQFQIKAAVRGVTSQHRCCVGMFKQRQMIVNGVGVGVMLCKWYMCGKCLLRLAASARRTSCSGDNCCSTASDNDCA